MLATTHIRTSVQDEFDSLNEEPRVFERCAQLENSDLCTLVENFQRYLETSKPETHDLKKASKRYIASSVSLPTLKSFSLYAQKFEREIERFDDLAGWFISELIQSCSTSSITLDLSHYTNLTRIGYQWEGKRVHILAPPLWNAFGSEMCRSSLTIYGGSPVGETGVLIAGFNMRESYLELHGNFRGNFLIGQNMRESKIVLEGTIEKPAFGRRSYDSTIEFKGDCRVPTDSVSFIRRELREESIRANVQGTLKTSDGRIIAW